LRPGFSKLRLVNYERRNFIAQRQMCGTTKQFRRRWATQTRAIVTTQGYSFLSLGARFGDGWHNNRPGASSPQSAGLQRPGLVLALTGLNPAASTLVAENVTFCAKKPLFYAARVSLSIAGFGPHRPGIGPTAASSDWYSARFVLGQGSATQADFLHRKWPPARIAAAKKFLESGFPIDVGCPLPLGSCGLSSTRHLRRAACSEANRRMRLCSRRGGIPEA